MDSPEIIIQIEILVFYLLNNQSVENSFSKCLIEYVALLKKCCICARYFFQ